MPPEPTPLHAAARRKHNDALQRATTALRELDARGETITFQAVARRARVSRQWLYQQPELRAEIEKLRATTLQRPTGVPARQRATETSLQSRLRVALDDNRRLRDEIAGLKHELALAYGTQRAAS